jgi:hypothetical protein
LNKGDNLLYEASLTVLNDLQHCLSCLSVKDYAAPSDQLSDASIGQHTRHIIELYKELLTGYKTGNVNYDKRKRNKTIETDLPFAMECLDSLSKAINLPNKTLKLETALGNEHELVIATDYHRELLYNLEHAIHHMALIRIGVRELTQVTLPEHFGVAPATIQHRNNTCAQ